MASKLYVGGLAYSTTSEGLREFFAQSGNVLSATVITDRFSGQSRGFGFVEMADGAEQAIAELNGTEFRGRAMNVNEAKPRGERPRGSQGGYGDRPKSGFGRAARRARRPDSHFMQFPHPRMQRVMPRNCLAAYAVAARRSLLGGKPVWRLIQRQK